MARTQADYPNSADLEAFLAAANLDVSDLDLETAVEAGVMEFEQRTGRIMLASEAEETRAFEPPYVDMSRSLSYLVLGPFNDVLRPVSVGYMPEGATVQAFAEPQDYLLDPNRGAESYRGIRFRRRYWMSPTGAWDLQSIQVTGRWGYGSTIPQDAWLAMLQLGALQLFTLLGAAAVSAALQTLVTSGGLVSWKEGDVSEDYGTAFTTALSSSAAPYAGLTQAWNKKIDATIRRYIAVDL